MDSSLFRYSPGWQVNADGADPPEPIDPFVQPSGEVTFVYTGANLALQLAVGDYWGYLYITIDGKPANLLPSIPGNLNSVGQPAGYKTLYEPENQTPTGPDKRWLHVHSAADATQAHDVRIEVWRSWGAAPLRAVGVDILSSPFPRWPGALLLAVAFWCAILTLFPSGAQQPSTPARPPPDSLRSRIVHAILGFGSTQANLLLGVGAGASIGLATALGWTPLALFALMTLGLASLGRPALWFAAFLFGLPFYYAFPLPLTPMRSFGLADVAVVMGLAVIGCHWLLRRWQGDVVKIATGGLPAVLLGVIATWAFISAVAADHSTVALREWRIVFLYGALIYWSLWAVHSFSHKRDADLWLLVNGWIGGATFFSLLSLALYQTDAVAFVVEGVRRLAGFYGSPNNLALYLGRTLPVTLALALFSHGRRQRLLWGALALPQLLTFLLTFSKGALLIALPAMLVTLWLGGWLLLRRRGQSTRILWWLAVAALVIAVAVTPVIGAERFQRLFDFSQGTSFLRINLWRSSLAMGLDHWLWGVGPDNFLYAYRSGYLLPQAWQEPNLNHPHQWVLDWWTRLGLGGLALGVAWWGIAIAYLARRIGCDDGDHGALRLGLLAAVAAALAHGLIDASFALPDLMTVWVFITFLAIAL